MQVTQSGSPGSVTDVSIRGATPSQTLVLVDGVEVNAGATGSFDFANLTTDNLDRVEVLRGAGGSLYGSQAIGGVVNVLSQEGEGAADGEPAFRAAAIARPASKLEPSAAPREISVTRARCRTFRLRDIARSTTTPTISSLNGRLDYHLGDDTVLRGFARYIASNVSLPNLNVASGSTAAIRPRISATSSCCSRAKSSITSAKTCWCARTRISCARICARPRTPYPGFMGSEEDRIPDETRGGLIEAVFTWPWLEGFRTLAGFDFKDRWVRSDGIFTFANFAPPPPLRQRR